MRCPNCMAENTTTRRFCAECGTPLPLACPSCGFENEATAKFCGGCGKPIEETANPPAVVPATSRVDSAERRQLTVMFCDLVGSTALSSRLDPEDLRETIGSYNKCVAETISRYDGFVATYMGDGVLAYFGYPIAHEDDPERAVRAGIAVVEAVRRLKTPELLRVRVGLATGLVIVGDLIGSGAAQEQAVVGETPNLAARLQALAEPEAIVIADNTRRLVGNLFEYQSLGEVEVKGLAASVPAYRVLGESRLRSRFEALRSDETPLIGREEETELLLRRWQQAKSGEGRVMLISGEPGIGKSRLTAMLQQHLRAEPHTRFRYFCSPHHQDSPLFPVISRLERAARFEPGDAPAVKLGKLRELLAPDTPREEDEWLIAELLSLPGPDHYSAPEISPQRKKEKTLEALLRQLSSIARRQPAMMVFEDLHWSDPISREFLDLLVERIERLPVLLIATFRPEFHPPWTGLRQVTLLTLARLERSLCTTLVERIAGGMAPLRRDVVDEIVRRTDGVPLFLEELTKAVLEATIAGEDDGRRVVAAVPFHPWLGSPNRESEPRRQRHFRRNQILPGGDTG